MDEKLKLIEKYLKKKKEHKIINLIIRNYEQSNFNILQQLIHSICKQVSMNIFEYMNTLT